VGVTARTMTNKGRCVCCGVSTAHKSNMAAVCEECDRAYGSIPIPKFGSEKRGVEPERVVEVKARWEAGWTVRIRPDLSGWEWIPPTVTP
jgi:hypothetical protein